MSFPTQDEIVARIKERKAGDLFGFETTEYLCWLDFEHAKPFLKPDATPDIWKDLPLAPNADQVVKVIRDYMPFAWEKANNRRGISALRSLAHMQAWLWLLGEEFHGAVDKLRNYGHYGKPQLRAICERFDIDWLSLDDGYWTNDEMARGRPPLPAAEIF